MFASITCLVTLCPMFAAEPQDDKAKIPAELQGAWKLESVQGDGTAGVSESRPVLVIKGNQLLYGGKAVARITADAATKPKVLDLHLAKPERLYEAVYSVDKDTLKICLNGQSDGVKERPQSFSVEGQPALRLLVLERVKTDDPSAGSGFVGLMLKKDEDRDEVVIADTLEGSPAKKAGLLKDDIVLKVGGTKVTDLRSAVDAARQSKPNSDLTIRVRRDGQERELTVRVGLLPFRYVAGLE
jgi:uncharacterized protein (TIGR03067 family)